MEQLIKDILKDIDCKFRFDRQFVVVEPQSKENNLRITLSNINHPGFFYEKYSVEIYEKLYDTEEFHGTQVRFIGSFNDSKV